MYSGQEEFRVTVVSINGKKTLDGRDGEFVNNHAGEFKNRLAYPLHLDGEWEVGLKSISVPDRAIKLGTVPEVQSTTLPLMKCTFGIMRKDETLDTYDHSVFYRSFQEDDSVVDGISFMKAWLMTHKQILNRLRTRQSDFGRREGTAIEDRLGNKTTFTFYWDGEDLVLDNSELLQKKGFKISFNKIFAEKMGWIYESNKTYVMGPNMNREFYSRIAPLPSDLSDKPENHPHYFKIKKLNKEDENENLLTLNTACSWRFRNLNSAFQSLLGQTKIQSMLVYSDLVKSSMVGNFKTDLLREIKYERTGKGINYFEPRHIQYLPVRSHTIEVISVELALTFGKTIKFSLLEGKKGSTTVTLHFRRKK